MTVIEIVKKHLVDNGYDGLVEDDANCGCDIESLAPCDQIGENCVAGYKSLCIPAICGHDEGCDWHISREKPVEP